MPTSSADPNLIPVDNPVLGMIDDAAARYGVDRNLAHTVAQMESNYNPKAQSGAGAIGVMQLMPGTARDMGVNNIWDPSQNIDGGVKYLAQLSKRYDGDPRLVMAAYNAGPGAVDKYGDVPPYTETRNYVTTGMRRIGSASRAADLSSDPNLTPVEAAPPAPQDLTPARTQAPVEVLPPLSEPPGPAKPPEKTFKGFLDNATVGLGRILEPLTDPAGTLENVTNLLQGMSEKSGFAPVMGQPRQQVVDGIVNLYKHRYGSLEGFKNAWYDDPVGMAADVATVFSGAGLGAKAAQDFLEASGLTQHAATLADIVPEAAAGTPAETRIQAGVRGAVEALGKRYKEVVQAGIEKAPSGVLGGPHGMLSTAKYGAARKAGEILKEGWQAGTKAFDAPAAAAPAAEAAAPAAEALTPGQILAKSQGQDWSRLSANDQAMLEQIAKGQANVTAQPVARPATAPAPAPEVPPATPPAAPPLTPQDLTELETGRPPSRQSEAAQQTAAETLATAQAATPPAAPVTPEAPPVAPAVPSAAEAPTSLLEARPKALEVARQLEDTTRADRITDFLKANFAEDFTPESIDKFDAHDWELIGKGAGGLAPTAEQITEVKANVTKAAAPVPTEVAKMPPAQAQAVVAPKLKKPPATAQFTAPEARIEALAQHFAKDTDLSPEAVASIAGNPEAARLLEKLGESLGIKGRPTSGEIPKIAARVRELRRIPK